MIYVLLDKLKRRHALLLLLLLLLLLGHNGWTVPRQQRQRLRI
jgi:hypothetical protein